MRESPGASAMHVPTAPIPRVMFSTLILWLIPELEQTKLR
jgi:hypothetical protein